MVDDLTFFCLNCIVEFTSHLAAYNVHILQSASGCGVLGEAGKYSNFLSSNAPFPISMEWDHGYRLLLSSIQEHGQFMSGMIMELLTFG